MTFPFRGTLKLQRDPMKTGLMVMCGQKGITVFLHHPGSGVLFARSIKTWLTRGVSGFLQCDLKRNSKNYSEL